MGLGNILPNPYSIRIAKVLRYVAGEALLAASRLRRPPPIDVDTLREEGKQIVFTRDGKTIVREKGK